MKKPDYAFPLIQNFLVFLLLLIPARAFQQNLSGENRAGQIVEGLIDKCGYDEEMAEQMRALLGRSWGYGYDSLLVDLQRWEQSPYVTIDSIGLSVQNRPLWQLTITSDAPPGPTPRHTVFIHARTHPIETEGFWVTNEIINLLLSEDPYAQFVRENCVFYIIPMYNPDGVELGYNRHNAHNVDLESNWNTYPPEPEVAALRNRFTQLMASPAPIEVALNMHSAYVCKRYFVYHDQAGTSYQYTLLEQNFINGVRSYFPGGIEPWDFFVSWTNGTPLVYPESWFWVNFGEAVMALTYEDMNCPEAGNYDSTAYALLHGVMDYLGLVTGIAENDPGQPQDFALHQNYPNPFNPETHLRFRIANFGMVRLAIYDLLGREVKVLVNEPEAPGTYTVKWDGRNDAGLPVAGGVYFYRLRVSRGEGSGNTAFAKVKKMMLTR